MSGAFSVSTRTTLAPIRLDWEEKSRSLVVTPKDQDRFCLNVEEAIDACKAHTEEKKFRLQFQTLLGFLGYWVQEHQKDIRDAIVTLQEGCILLLVVKENTSYEDSFEDALTKLDLAVARDPVLDLIRLTVLALPNCSDSARASFINPDLFLIYPNGK